MGDALYELHLSMTSVTRISAQHCPALGGWWFSLNVFLLRLLILARYCHSDLGFLFAE